MNIKDIDYQKELVESNQFLGAQSTMAHAFDEIEHQFRSLTGEIVGNINAFSNVTAIGTNKANVSVSSDVRGNTDNKVSIVYGTETTAFATTPGT
ncbi:hypothetical protein C7H19_22730 [Aphanothece hegewaldii CCALA 016]|uniref:Uncharacterized protein n=1 Tax=Aphanothece hegewaldii CCALA 016 TaxID=2107694 RepID=A0A2T1LRM2_9CHRO|nr:hypothetical protein [Aphanothece hegewaldii]PSF31396.1 hypothetical protein C7H19_22730 [Aphanothece hegewaldii CCALA 016]